MDYKTSAKKIFKETPMMCKKQNKTTNPTNMAVWFLVMLRFFQCGVLLLLEV